MLREYVESLARYHVTVLVFIFIATSTNEAFADKNSVKIGVLAHRGEDVARAMWEPTAEYLAKAIPEYSFKIIPVTNDTIGPAVSKKQVDFVLTNPASYATLESNYGISRIVTLRNLRPGGSYTRFGAIIFTRADRDDINSLTDLKGKSFMAVHPDAFGGWWMAWREMKAKSINPNKDFANIKFAGFPQDQIILAVKNGLIDAGTVRTDILERMYADNKLSRGEFKILNKQHTKGFPFAHSTRLYPEWPFATLRHIDHNFAKKVAIALLSIPKESKAAKSAILSGWTVPLDYQPVHELMNELRVGPYKEIGDITIQDLLHQYGYWIILSLLALLVMAATIFHIAFLNRKLIYSTHLLEHEIDERKRAEDESLHLNRLLDESSNEIVVFDAKTYRFIQANQGAQKHLGYTLEEFKQMTPLDICPEFTKNDFVKMTKTLFSGKEQQLIFETNHLRRDESTYPVEVRLHLSHALGKQVFVAVLEDITERKEAEYALQQEKEQAQITLESIGDAVITTDSNGIIEYLNPVAEKLTAWKCEEVINKPLMSIIELRYQESGKSTEDPITRSEREGGFTSINEHVVLIGRNNKRAIVHEIVTPRCTPDGKSHGTVLVFRDVSELYRLHREMSYYATHDDLTGLVNRRTFSTVLEQALNNTGAEIQQHALLYLDLDNFKIINDSCGHTAGDKLLIIITNQLKGVVRNADTVARLGGDEFSILLHGCILQEATKIAESICKKIKEIRFNWKGRGYKLGVSIGVVPIDSKSGAITDVLGAADNACYVAKNKGRNRYYVYNSNDISMQKHRGEMRWIHKMYEALEDNRFTLHSQLIKKLNTANNSSIFVEVLLRMSSEENNLIRPSYFIPAAERYQMMPAIDRWVITNTMSLMKEYQDNISNLCFSINLSGQSIGNKTFIHEVIDQIDQYNVNPEQLCFEITETAAIENFHQAIQFISVLHGMGSQFSLDDFGSGMSSFSYLKNIPVDYIKIDGSFVKNIANNQADYAMVKAISQVGSSMGIQTVAESVETDDVIDKLVPLGIDYVQGFGIQKPQPILNILQPKIVCSA